MAMVDMEIIMQLWSRFVFEKLLAANPY